MIEIVDIKFDDDRVYNKITKAIELNANVERVGRIKASQVLSEAKTDLINGFRNDEASKEILAGPMTDSSYLSKGNLYSFLGFEISEKNPVDKVSEYLNQEIKLSDEKGKIDKSKYSGMSEGERRLANLEYVYKVNIPSEAEIEDKTKLPDKWADISWLRAVENGVSGLVYYIFSRSKRFSQSRSGPAIQTHNPIKGRDTDRWSGTGSYFFKKYYLKFKNAFKRSYNKR